MRKIFVGTSGWNYKHWKGVFYPPEMAASKWLDHYVKFFNSVELNVTFYRLVRKETFEGWYKKTPKDFYFVAKGSRFITHIKRIKSVAKPLDVFLKNVKGLRQKLAAILWQFAPSFKKDLGRLEIFLKLLKRKTKVRQALEFRHETWFDQEVYDLLKSYGACLCTAHSPRRPPVKIATSDFIYLRFHEAAPFNPNYSDQKLKEWAEYARGYRQQDIMAFFNNDAQGFAVKNGLKFKELLWTIDQ